MNILVSGIAGDIGFGIGRILSRWDWPGSVHGIDVHSEHPGCFVFDRVNTAPYATDSSYFGWLRSYIERHDIGLFIPSSEAEISALSEGDVKSIGGADILIANQQAVRLSLDKYRCMLFLNEKGIRVPEHGIVGVSTPCRFPVIVKPRAGQGSKNIQRFDSKKEFERKAESLSLWQEYLASAKQEYTCAVYRSKRLGIRTLVMQRTLTGGLTSRGEVVDNPAIDIYVRDIAKHLDVNGCINVQLRLTETGPCLFEINPRLSSTLVFRDLMGFTDLRWWVRDTLGDPFAPALSTYTPPKEGTRFYRGAMEYVTPAHSFE